MKAFTIENETNNITVHATMQDADAVADAVHFRNEAALLRLAANWPAARLVEIWNSLPGETPVKEFKDRANAVSRIWKAIQSLGQTAQPEFVVPEPTPATPVAQQTSDVASQEPLAKTKTAGAKKVSTAATNDGARKGSKTEAILSLMKQPGGSSLKAIMDATGWQAHSVRGFISGTLGKKMSLTVVSTKAEAGERSYSITSVS